MSKALTWQDFEDAAVALDCDISAIRAVCQVEAPKGGFNPDGSVSTLFEGHKFYKYTNGAYAESHPTLCFKTWTKAHYGKTWQQEQARLHQAIALDRYAAFRSASWGKFQIMGFNYAMVGFNSANEFVEAMDKDERTQLLAFVEFVKKSGLTAALRNHDWATFARGYNGAGYAQNAYDVKLASAYAKFSQEVVAEVAETIQELPAKAAHPLIVAIMALFKFINSFKKP
jgi:N-acetylmuramidase